MGQLTTDSLSPRDWRDIIDLWWPYRHYAYSNFSTEQFVGYVMRADRESRLRLARDVGGRVDYVCIWNTDTPDTIYFEWVAGRGAQWVADLPDLIGGFTYWARHRRNIYVRRRVLDKYLTKSYL